MINNETARVVAVLLSLLALKAIDSSGWTVGTVGARLDTLVSTLSNRGLNKEAREALTAGYYEGLINEGSRLSTMNRFVLDTRRLQLEDNRRAESRQTNDFLYFEHVPNVATPDYDDDRFKYIHTTNSAGLGDKEYALEKPAGVRRIAVLGDSITRGLGAPQGGNFESLLEDRLNESHTSAATRQFELLNFAVAGYHITQLLESAKVKAAPYRPDVYLLVLTDLSVYRRWHGHISSLMYAGIDLKYDYLRKMISEARLTAKDPIGTFDARLARYRIPTVRWVLAELQEHAAATNAKLVVVLAPSTEDPDALAEAFLGVREMLADARIPAIDLLDTFRNDDDRLAARVADGDRHPNEYGHRLLFERLYQRLQQDPALMSALIGGN